MKNKPKGGGGIKTAVEETWFLKNVPEKAEKWKHKQQEKIG